MKKMKFTICALFAALTFLVLPSCDDDDDDGPGSAQDLIGWWDCTYVEGWEKINGEIVEEFAGPGDERGEFRADGTTYSYSLSGGRWVLEEEGVWSYSKGILTVKYWDEYDEDYTYGGKIRITKLTSSEMEGERFDSETEDGDKYEYYTRGKYRKISGLDAD